MHWRQQRSLVLWCASSMIYPPATNYRIPRDTFHPPTAILRAGSISKPRRGDRRKPRATPWVGWPGDPLALKGRQTNARASPLSLLRGLCLSLLASQGVALGYHIPPLQGEIGQLVPRRPGERRHVVLVSRRTYEIRNLVPITPLGLGPLLSTLESRPFPSPWTLDPTPYGRKTHHNLSRR